MKLIDYRKKQGLSRAKAGDQLGVHGITIYRYETGRAIPQPTMLRRIIEWSDGRVTANDLVAPAMKRGAA